jgi:hypothetical protein
MTRNSSRPATCMPPKPAALLTLAAGVLALSACLHVDPGQAKTQVAPPPGATPAIRQLIAAKARLMAADYHADLAELARLRDQVALLGEDPATGYLVHYWSGFASWRLAINGASHGMSRDDLRTHLERAATELDAAIRLRDDFADAYAAAAGVNSWLPIFYSESDPATFRQRLERLRAKIGSLPETKAVASIAPSILATAQRVAEWFAT